jgi:hypothetical protein
MVEAAGGNIAQVANKGVVDMVLLIGLYLATCSLINAFEVPAPDPIQRSA